MRRLLILVPALLSVFDPAPLRADENKLVESIEVRVTSVDVVVTDRNGNPVSGLTKDDFQLLENRKRQTITNFYEVRADRTAPSVAATDSSSVTAPVPAPEAPPDLRHRRVIFFLDEFSSSPFRRNQVIQSMTRSLDTIVGTGDETMLVTWNRSLHIIEPFTADKAKVRKALHELEGHGGGSGTFSASIGIVKSRVMSEIEEAQQRHKSPGAALQASFGYARTYGTELFAIERSLAAAMRIALTTLAGVDGKKVMVYAGEHLPDRPAAEIFAWIEQQFMTSFSITPSGAGVTQTQEFSMTLPFEAVATQANSSGVTMYMIDVADSRKGAMPTAESNDADDSVTSFTEFTNSAQSFQTIAKLTGGIALTQTPNFDIAFNTITKDLNAYYSLGYRPSDDKASRRSLVVKVNNPNLHVRSRRSYVLKSGEEQTNDLVIANIFQASSKSEMPIELQARAPVRGPNRRWQVPVKIVIPATLTLLRQRDNLAGGFTVLVAVGDETGAMSDVARRSQPVRLPAAQEAAFRSKPITFDMQVEVERGEHTLSVGVVDQLTNASGFARAKIVAR